MSSSEARKELASRHGVWLSEAGYALCVRDALARNKSAGAMGLGQESKRTASVDEVLAIALNRSFRGIGERVKLDSCSLVTLEIVEAVNLSAPLSAPTVASSPRLLCLTLTDDRESRYRAIEHSPIAELKSLPVPGTKLTLRNFTLLRGVVLMTPQSFVGLSGRVEELEASWRLQQDRDAARSHSLAHLQPGEQPPPPFVSFKEAQSRSQSQAQSRSKGGASGAGAAGASAGAAVPDSAELKRSAAVERKSPAKVPRGHRDVAFESDPAASSGPSTAAAAAHKKPPPGFGQAAGAPSHAGSRPAASQPPAEPERTASASSKSDTAGTAGTAGVGAGDAGVAFAGSAGSAGSSAAAAPTAKAVQAAVQAAQASLAPPAASSFRTLLQSAAGWIGAFLVTVQDVQLFPPTAPSKDFYLQFHLLDTDGLAAVATGSAQLFSHFMGANADVQASMATSQGQEAVRKRFLNLRTQAVGKKFECHLQIAADAPKIGRTFTLLSIGSFRPALPAPVSTARKPGAGAGSSAAAAVASITAAAAASAADEEQQQQRQGAQASASARGRRGRGS